MDQLFTLANLDHLGSAGALTLVALLVITDKLVWHTRLKAADKRAERWEKACLEALTLGATAGVKAAEVAVGVVSSIPDPQQVRNDAAAYRSETGGPI